MNEAFVEYAQARGFHVDPARVRRPQDKPRVERTVQFVRNSIWAGETFIDLADAQRHAEEWCAGRAGQRVHGTTQCARPSCSRWRSSRGCCRRPTAVMTCRSTRRAKVHRDHHIEVAKALYSMPGNLIGQRVDVRADRQLVRIYLVASSSSPTPANSQAGVPPTRPICPTAPPSTRCATSTTSRLAAGHGPAIGDYATALLDIPLPWTKMRQVYALLGLVKKWGPERVNAACARALEAEAVNVGLIGRMLERGTENTPIQPALPGTVVTGRFTRDPDHFAVGAGGR